MARKKRNNFVLKIALCIFTVYAVYNFVSLQIAIDKKKADLAALEAKIYTQQITNQQLAESKDKELTDEEIAKIARDKLGYALPGERVFIDITGK